MVLLGVLHGLERLLGIVERLILSQWRLLVRAVVSNQRKNDHPLSIGGLEQRRKLVLLDKVRAEERGTDEQDRYSRPLQRNVDLCPPLRSGCNPTIVPYVEFLTERL